MNPFSTIKHSIAKPISCIFAGLLLILSGCDSPKKLGSTAADAAYEKGITALEMFDFNEAYAQLSKVQPHLSSSDPKWLEATYAYAIASWHRPPPDPDSIEKAVGLFRELLEADISDDWKTRARLSLARIYEINDYPNDEVDLAAARELYKEVQTEYPIGEFGYQASLRLGQTYVQELEDEPVAKGIGIIREQIERDPESVWATVAWQYLGDLYEKSVNDTNLALDCYLKAEALGFANVSRSDVYLWRMSLWAIENGRDDLAVRIRTRIVEEFPRSPYGTLSRDYVREYAAEHPDKGIVPPQLMSW